MNWHCHRCGRSFMHGRFLVRHLIDVHNEGAAACRPGVR